MNVEDKKIQILRKKIDSIDSKIIELLNKRMNASIKVGKIKSKLDVPIQDKDREQTIIDRLIKLKSENLSDDQLINIFSAVFKSSRDIQK